MGISFLLFFAFHFSSQLFVRPPQTAILPFCISWRWFWSPPPVQCHEPPSTVLQALCLSDLIPQIYLSLPLYNCKGFEWSSGFPYFLQFKSEVCNKEIRCWAEIHKRKAPCLSFLLQIFPKCPCSLVTWEWGRNTMFSEKSIYWGLHRQEEKVSINKWG